jgi:hypothetical protein
MGVQGLLAAHMNRLLFASTFLLAASVAVAAEPENLHAWYRPDALKTDGANIRAWENSAASGAGRSLSRIAGSPRAWRVSTGGEERTVVRLDGKSAHGVR